MFEQEATVHTLDVHTDGWFARRSTNVPISWASARVRNPRQGHSVSVFETTDRDGNGLYVAHVHYRPCACAGTDAVEVTEIYEVPTAVRVLL